MSTKNINVSWTNGKNPYFASKLSARKDFRTLLFRKKSKKRFFMSMILTKELCYLLTQRRFSLLFASRECNTRLLRTID